MRPGVIILIVVCVLLLCCLAHRRVIRALIRHEPMPKSPNRHFRVKKENTRS